MNRVRSWTSRPPLVDVSAERHAHRAAHCLRLDRERDPAAPARSRPDHSGCCRNHEVHRARRLWYSEAFRMSADSKRQIGEARSRRKLDTDVATGNSCPAAGRRFLSTFSIPWASPRRSAGHSLFIRTWLRPAGFPRCATWLTWTPAYGIACHAWSNLYIGGTGG